MSTVTVGAITYQRRGNGHWFQGCGVEMPRRDWRWLDEIERLRGELEKFKPWHIQAAGKYADDGVIIFRPEDMEHDEDAWDWFSPEDYEDGTFVCYVKSEP